MKRLCGLLLVVGIIQAHCCLNQEQIVVDFGFTYPAGMLNSAGYLKHPHTEKRMP